MLAQSLDRSAGPPPPNQPEGPGIPIDTNIYILIFLGLIYGGYIAFKKYRTKNNSA